MAALTATQLAACTGYQASVVALQATVASQAAAIATLSAHLTELIKESGGRVNKDLNILSTASKAASDASAVVLDAGVIKHDALLAEE